MNDGLVKDPNRIYAGFFLRYTMPEGGTPLAKGGEATSEAPASEEPVSDRNPSSFQEASVPGTPTTSKQ